MSAPAFNDRIERKFQLGVKENEVAELWRDLGSVLAPHGLSPVQEITSVGSVYFDNKDCDLLRLSLSGHLMLFRTRVYESYGRLPEPISEYWVEVKTAYGWRRKKRRFPVTKAALIELLNTRDFDLSLKDPSPNLCAPEYFASYREARETLITMGLQPLLLVLCKRVAFQGATERVSIDWDIQYHYVTNNIYELSSWKYLPVPPAGGAGKVILELKYLGDDGMPSWFVELERRYPIWQREYLKPVEGMAFLFRGPLRNHTQADYFLPLIDAYMESSLLG